MNNKNNILVIKHGALGDFILSFGPFLSIRKNHLNDHVVLLTGSKFKQFAEDSNLFNEIIIDDRPSFIRFDKILKLGLALRKKNFSRVYDLQTSDRSDFYFNFFRMQKNLKTEWSGTALGCSHPDKNKERNKIHTIERHKLQLENIGIKKVKLSDFSWVKSKKNFNIKKPYILISPGSSPNRPKKRWPEINYAEIAKKFRRIGILPVVIGEKNDENIAKFISMNATGTINLVGKTSIHDLCVLARDASLAIGNDTGPMHAISMSGCNVIVLFSNDSNPIRSAPRSVSKKRKVKVIFKNDLRKLPKENVIETLYNDFGYKF